MSKLVIVESPAKAKNIKKYLGKGYDVIASMGHIRDLPSAKLSVDVKKDFEPKYAIVKGKESLVKELKDKAKESEQVYLATDPDREGEAISWHLANVLGLDLDSENRVTFNEITKSGVQSGMKEPRKVDLDLVDAQQARRILDRLVGYKLSPFVSQKIRRGLSAGRVQSVAVRLIADREEEIRNFVPEEYWTIDAKFTAKSRKVFVASLVSDENGKVKISSKKDSDKYLSKLENAEYYVEDVKKGTKQKNPAPPFITSTLQQEASKRLNFHAQRTMRAAQELYEGIEIKDFGTTGLITYMRTDSLRISEEARAQTAEFISKNYGEKYLPDKPRYFKSRSNAQDGHEAIRPTMVELTPDRVKDSLTSDQFKIYSLVWKRFVASLMSNCVMNTLKISIKSQKEGENGYCIFNATSQSVKFDGFTVLYEVKEDDENEKTVVLPDLNKSDIVKLKELIPGQHFTQPPARYTEASLIKTLELNGVGRPSTYATIMTTITKREYVKRQSKSLVPTELGEATTTLLKSKFPKIVNVKYTASMEENLDEIAKGQENYKQMLRDFYDDFDSTLKKAKEEMEGVKIELKEDKTDIPCEKCGRMMVIKTGRFGRFLACPGYPECKNTKPLVTKTDAKCPICSGDVITRKSKKGYTFYGCSNWSECNFMTWDAPTGEKCPNCSNNLFKNSKNELTCLAENCGFKKPASTKKKNNDE